MNDIAWCRTQVFERLWSHYYQLVPIAPVIEKAFTAKKESWIEDHVAFRTLPGQNIGMHVLQRLFELLGYSRQDDYKFEDKKLNAFWMSPDDINGHSSEASAKIFISELLPESFSSGFKAVLESASSQVKESIVPYLEHLHKDVIKKAPGAKETFVATISQVLTSGPAWAKPTYEDYVKLRDESEYAAWTYLFGHQINHFTLSVHLNHAFPVIADLGKYLETDLKIPMNHSGGLVKGTSNVLLEQIATMASKIDFQFQDRLEAVSYGFVEFAKRYPLKGKSNDGQWSSYYQGFVAANADKIFESTYK